MAQLLTSNNPGPIYTATGVAPTFTTISVYGWVFLANRTSGYQWLFGKQYDNGDWVSPNAGVFRFYYTNAGDGTWVVVIRPVGSAEVTETISTPWKIPLNVWCFLGFTWDGSNIAIYFNGDLIQYDTGIASNQPLDFSGNGHYGFGGVPHLGGTGGPGDPLQGKLSDWWIDSVVRSPAWFAMIFTNGIGRPYLGTQI